MVGLIFAGIYNRLIKVGLQVWLFLRLLVLSLLILDLCRAVISCIGFHIADRLIDVTVIFEATERDGLGVPLRLLPLILARLGRKCLHRDDLI